MADRKRGGELAQALDHPIFFTFVIALTTIGWLAIMTYIAKAANVPGLAALAQHP